MLNPQYDRFLYINEFYLELFMRILQFNLDLYLYINICKYLLIGAHTFSL